MTHSGLDHSSKQHFHILDIQKSSSSSLNIPTGIPVQFGRMMDPNATERELMGQGWIKGLKKLFNDNIHVSLKEKIYPYGRSEETGEIDVVISSNQPFTIQDIFPSGYDVRPRKSFISTKFMADVKQLDNESMDYEKIIDEFVNFYYDLLRADRASVIDIRKLGSDVENAIEDVSTVLLFVFNGVDPVAVHKQMQCAITAKTHNPHEMQICGHQVVCVWCKAHVLINWAGVMEYEALCKENKLLKRRLARCQRKEQQLVQVNVGVDVLGVPAGDDHKHNQDNDKVACKRKRDRM